VRQLGIAAVLGSTCLGIAYADAAVVSDETLSAIDRLVEHEMREVGIPGVALTIVEDDRVVHLRGFGVADASGRAVSPQTPFPIASISKSFTALAVMQLAEEEKLDLDATVRSYVPWFDIGGDADSSRITIRHLLTQRSGIAGDSDRYAYGDSDRSSAALERNVRRLASNEVLIAAPGSAYHYCNANYDVLSYLVEMGSGQSYERYLSDHVFAPLGMARSYTSFDDARREGLAAGYHRWWGIPIPTEMLQTGRASVGSAGLASTAEDLSHWLIAHLNEGRYAGQSVLSADAMAELHRPSAPIGAESGFWGYAMGWGATPAWDAATESRDQSRLDVPIYLAHGGVAPNYHGSLQIFPDRNVAFAVLMNTYDTTTPRRYEHLEDSIRALVLGAATPPIFPETEPLKAAIKVIAVGLVGFESVVATWSLRRLRRTSSRRSTLVTVVIAGLAYIFALAVAFGYLPGQVRDFLLGVMLNRFSDLSATVVALVAVPLLWLPAVVAVLLQRTARVERA
jgi:CubicO group peptidase (beta-lactamase class C family)